VDFILYVGTGSVRGTQFLQITVISNCPHSECESQKSGESVMFYLSSPYTSIVC